MKKAISEIDAKYKAKIAEKNFPRKKYFRVMQSGAEETVQKITPTSCGGNHILENKAEREKESIHEQK